MDRKIEDRGGADVFAAVGVGEYEDPCWDRRLCVCAHCCQYVRAWSWICGNVMCMRVYVYMTIVMVIERNLVSRALILKIGIEIVQGARSYVDV